MQRKGKYILLLIVGIFLTIRYLLYQDFSFTVLSTQHALKIAAKYENHKLLKGEKISSTFKASENNLGIVALRFTTFGRKNNDTILFRLKKKEDTSWMYETSVRTTFSDNELYNFGLPIQDNSQGIRYDFEIESEKGTTQNSIGLSEISPQLVTKYKFPKSYFLSDPKVLPEFLLKKAAFIFSDQKNAFTIALFFLPLLFILILSKIIRSQKEIILFFTLLMILESFIVKGVWEDSMILTTILLIFVTRANKNQIRSLVQIAIVLLIWGLVLYSLSFFHVAEKAIIWAFFILAAATLISIFDTIDT